MSHSNNDHIERALRSAEAREMFFHASDQATRHQLDRRTIKPDSGKHAAVTAGPAVVKIRCGLYARAAYWDVLTKTQRYIHLLRSLQDQHPEWVFCMQSAAAAHGLPVPHAHMNRVHLATYSGTHGVREDVARHRITMREVTIASNLRVTPLLRTGFDCARVFDFGHGLAICDALLRRLGWSPKQLVSAFQSIPGRHRLRQQALYAASHANALSESTGESMARAAMIELGFAVPELQVEVARPLEPNRTYRIDFCWTLQDGSRVFGEFDGNVKYEDPRLLKGRSAARVLASEQHRESQLMLLGAPMLRLCYRDIMDPARLASILSSYGIPRTPGNGA